MSTGSVWGNDKTKFFHELTPSAVLNAIDILGYQTTGRLGPMGSMENRVYEIEVINEQAKTPSENFVIAKFYRPGRWSGEQIQAEHDFLFDLEEVELRVIAPIKISNQSLFLTPDGLYYALFPKQGGRACDEWNDDLLEQMGRLLARLHSVGSMVPKTPRLALNIQNFGINNLEIIEHSPYMPSEYKTQYLNLCKEIFEASTPFFKHIKNQRIHGDCHHGNILLAEGRPFLIDFDDMSMGPTVQDIWMCIPGRDDYSIMQRNKLIDAYCEMKDFDFRELKLIEPLRALRIIHFSAWISLRFEDQAFKNSFNHFGSVAYWEQEMSQLTEQLSLIRSQECLN